MTETTRFATIQELSSKASRVVRVTTKSGSKYTVSLMGVGAQRTVVFRGQDKDGSRIEIQDPGGTLQNGRSLFDVDPEDWVGFGLDVGSMSTSRVAAVEEVNDLEEVTTFRGVQPRSSRDSAPEKTAGPAAPRGLHPPEAPRQETVRVVDLRALMARSPEPEPEVAYEAPRAPRPLIVAEEISVPMSLEPPPRPQLDPGRQELEDRVLDLEYAAAYLNRIHRHRKALQELDHHPDLLDRFEAAFSLCTLTVEALSKNIIGEDS